MQFRDRAHAGRFLVERLAKLAGRPDVIVLALPRGGVPIGYEVARALGAPLDVLVVRKLGVPQQPELAMGAIASGGTRVLNRSVLDALGPNSMEMVERVAKIESKELQERELKYRGARPSPELRDRIVILVDDGLATGSTMRAAAQAVRQHAPAKLIIAVPVAAESSCVELETEADQVICATTPEPFFGVGQFYEDFSQTTDEEVRQILKRTNDAEEPNE
jgi:putative phosphoribosyl transferase